MSEPLKLDPHKPESELEAEASTHPILGVNYFAARDISERFMAKFSAEMFKPLLDKFVDQFREQMWNEMQAWLIDDTQANLAGEIRRRVESAIEALLLGNPAYIDQFVLPEYSTHGLAIRESIAKAIPAELQSRRIADLEEQVATLKQSLEFRRRSY